MSYGLYVVSAARDGRFNGQVANTVFQVSGAPPAIAVSINRQNLTHEFITGSGLFTVSVLEQDAPLALIGLFGFRSGREVDKFRDVAYALGTTGLPYLTENVLAYLEARVTARVEAGTHTVFVAELVGAEVLKPGVPMTYAHYHQVKRGIVPPSAPTYRQEKEAEPVSRAQRYVCQVCGYIYDPETGDPDQGVAPGTPFDRLPAGWTCPVCGASQDEFRPED